MKENRIMTVRERRIVEDISEWIMFCLFVIGWTLAILFG